MRSARCFALLPMEFDQATTQVTDFRVGLSQLSKLAGCHRIGQPMMAKSISPGLPRVLLQLDDSFLLISCRLDTLQGFQALLFERSAGR